MRKKVLITVAAIFFIALNATVFTDVAKTSNVTLSSIFKSAFAISEMEPIHLKAVRGDECPVGPDQLAGANGYATDCEGRGDGCASYDCN